MSNTPYRWELFSGGPCFATDGQGTCPSHCTRRSRLALMLGHSLFGSLILSPLFFVAVIVRRCSKILPTLKRFVSQLSPVQTINCNHKKNELHSLYTEARGTRLRRKSVLCLHKKDERSTYPRRENDTHVSSQILPRQYIHNIYYNLYHMLFPGASRERGYCTIVHFRKHTVYKKSAVVSERAPWAGSSIWARLSKRKEKRMSLFVCQKLGSSGVVWGHLEGVLKGVDGDPAAVALICVHLTQILLSREPPGEPFFLIL